MDDVSNGLLFDALGLVDVLEGVKLLRPLVLDDSDLLSTCKDADRGNGRVASTHLAESALPDSTMEVKVVEIDLAVKVDGLRAAAEDPTHAVNVGWREGGGGRLYVARTRRAKRARDTEDKNLAPAAHPRTQSRATWPLIAPLPGSSGAAAGLCSSEMRLVCPLARQ